MEYYTVKLAIKLQKDIDIKCILLQLRSLSENTTYVGFQLSD